VPALPSSLLEPVWVEFAALLPDRGQFHPDHPLGCHRRRIPDRIVFEHLIDAMVHGSGYERVATAACSDSTIRRRLKDWAAAGIAEQIHAIALAAYHRVIGLDLEHIGVDGCITKAPCGGEKAGPSPVDRRKGGLTISSHRHYRCPPERGIRRRQPPRLTPAGTDTGRNHPPGRRPLAEAGHRTPGRRLRLHHHPAATRP
jgi:hypothetical protein